MTVAQKYKIPAELKQQVESQIKRKEDLFHLFIAAGYDSKKADRMAIQAMYSHK